MNGLAGEYDLIYADPPWSYEQGGNPHGGVDKHYPTMALDDIKAFDPPAADDCILYLWATAPLAQDAFEVMDSWGFEYKSQAVWDKVLLGVGYWFRGQHGLLYVGVRGTPSPPDPQVRRSSVFRERRGEHSAKPKAVREWIDRAYPDKSKVELFARDGFVGWDVWGNEAPDSKQTRLGATQ